MINGLRRGPGFGDDWRELFFGHKELPDLVNNTEGAEFELWGGGMALPNGRNIKQWREMARGPDYFPGP